MAQSLAPIVGGFKLGPRLLHRFGPDLVQKIAAHGPVFIDCKFFDIPSTTVAAVQACFEAGASLVTVHALVGAKTLTELAALEKKLSQQRPFKILCVTILTSWSESDYPSIIKPHPVIENVRRLARDVATSGLTGLVCSGQELMAIDVRNTWCLVPGVRRAQDATGDQSRLITPEQALKSGAAALVIGRPIVEAKDPVVVAQEFAQIIKSVSAP